MHLHERIRGSELEPPELETLATELRSHPVTVAADWLFQTLNDEPIEVVVRNVFALFRILLLSEPVWHRLLVKSISKRGRCPSPLRPGVRRLLGEEGDRRARNVSITKALTHMAEVSAELEDRPPPPKVIITEQRRLVQRRRRTATLTLTTALTDIIHMENLAEALAKSTQSEPDPIDEVVLDFSGVEHAYVVGLAALVSWFVRSGVRISYLGISRSTQAYLERIRFFDALTGGSLVAPSQRLDEYAVAIERLDSTSTADALAGRIVHVIGSHMPLSEPEAQALAILFAELLENVARHAGPDVVAYACAQAYPKKRKLTVCVVDSGWGIRESFLNGDNADARSRVQRGESALDLACRPLVTSKSRQHSGYGLYVASELVMRNGGTFRLLSDNEAITRFIHRYKKVFQRSPVVPPWRGTWIALLLDLTRNLSVLDVYRTLPTDREVKDFFEP